MTVIEPEVVDAEEALRQDMRDIVANTLCELGLNPSEFMEGEPMKNVTSTTMEGEPLELQYTPFSGPINVTVPSDSGHEQWEQMISQPLDKSSYEAPSYPLSTQDEEFMSAEIANLLYYAVDNDEVHHDVYNRILGILRNYKLIR